MGIFDFFQPKSVKIAITESERAEPHSPAKAIHVDDMPQVRYRAYGGENQPGTLGAINITQLDYWTLRKRSDEFFSTRLFARGLVRRLVTGVVTAGLYLECIPVESLLGKPEDSLTEWAEDTEQRFTIWGKDAFLCDATEQHTFGALQEAAFREALVSGDALVTMVADSVIEIPRVRLYRGDTVQTPALQMKLAAGNSIKHGVELDKHGRHVAYWVTQEDGTHKRLACWGPRSGRRLAWLVYASDRRLDEVRGMPLLSLALQNMAQLERYRDSTLTKAELNAKLALWIEKTEDRPGSRALSAGAVRVDATVATTSDGSTSREFQRNQFMDGWVVEELQTGEKIHQTGGNGTDEKYGEFEEAITQGVAWAYEIPPEILRLSFSSNYSASKAAENNFAVYLFKTRTFFGEQFCQPIYVEWLLSECLAGNVQAPGLIESWRDPKAYVTFGAWTLSDWSGNVKPSVDPVKQVNAYDRAIMRGLIDPATACREFSGQKLSRNLRALTKYMAALKEAGVPNVMPEPVQADPNEEESDDDDDEDRKDREDAA